MKVLMIHNYYQIRGGEDAVFENETALLVDNGWEVSRFSVHNDSITGALGKLKAAFSIVFSFSKFFELKKMLRDIQPDVVHVHNYFPLISPAVFYACASLGVPVVHSLHNYRAICPTATLMHEGQLCDRSVKAGSWWCVAKKVYRNSYLGSFFVCAMVEIHKRIGTWQEKVDCFIALTDTARRKYVDAGWPACKMVVKPNFLIDSSIASVPDAQKEHYAIFVGRLSQEKGLEVLIRAWQEIGLPLLVVGEGDAPVVHDSNPNIRYLGRKVKGETLELIHQADFLVMPSLWHETFGMVLIEAFAVGTPVVASRLGGMAEIVDDGRTGLHVVPGSAKDLKEKVQYLIDHPEVALEMGNNARQEYLKKYTPEINFEMLSNIYRRAIDSQKQR